MLSEGEEGIWLLLCSRHGCNLYVRRRLGDVLDRMSGSEALSLEAKHCNVNA